MQLGTASKIVFVHCNLKMGGAEVLRLSILQEMVLRKFDIEVVVCEELGEIGEQVRQLGVQVTVLGNRGGLFDFAGARKLARTLKVLQPDIVQSSMFLANLHSRFAIRGMPQVKHIIEEHGIYTWKKWRHRFLDRTFNAKADAVIACSHQVAKSAANDLNLPIEKISVVHNCVGRHHLNASEWSDEVRKQKRNEFCNSPDRPPRLVLGVVGTLRWEKGHRFLFEAWDQLQEEGTLTDDDHLLVVGDGPLMSDLSALAKDAKNVHFLGNVSDSQEYLWTMDLFVLPSINEGFGIVIAEAMAAEVPVVATKSGGIPEIINQEGLGLLAAPENTGSLIEAIRKMALNKDLRSIIGHNGREAAIERYSPSVYVDQLEALYEKL